MTPSKTCRFCDGQAGFMPRKLPGCALRTRCRKSRSNRRSTPSTNGLHKSNPRIPQFQRWAVYHLKVFRHSTRSQRSEIARPRVPGAEEAYNGNSNEENPGQGANGKGNDPFSEEAARTEMKLLTWRGAAQIQSPTSAQERAVGRQPQPQTVIGELHFV